MDIHQILRLGRAVTSYYKQAEDEPENNEGLEKYMQRELAPEDFSYWQHLGGNALNTLPEQFLQGLQNA